MAGSRAPLKGRPAAGRGDQPRAADTSGQGPSSRPTLLDAWHLAEFSEMLTARNIPTCYLERLAADAIPLPEYQVVTIGDIMSMVDDYLADIRYTIECKLLTDQVVALEAEKKANEKQLTAAHTEAAMAILVAGAVGAGAGGVGPQQTQRRLFIPGASLHLQARAGLLRHREPGRRLPHRAEEHALCAARTRS